MGRTHGSTHGSTHASTHGSNPWFEPIGRTHGSNPWLDSSVDPWVEPLGRTHRSNPWLEPMARFKGRPMGRTHGSTHGSNPWVDPWVKSMGRIHDSKPFGRIHRLDMAPIHVDMIRICHYTPLCINFSAADGSKIRPHNIASNSNAASKKPSIPTPTQRTTQNKSARALCVSRCLTNKSAYACAASEATSDSNCP